MIFWPVILLAATVAAMNGDAPGEPDVVALSELLERIVSAHMNELRFQLQEAVADTLGDATSTAFDRIFAPTDAPQHDVLDATDPPTSTGVTLGRRIVGTTISPSMPINSSGLHDKFLDEDDEFLTVHSDPLQERAPSTSTPLWPLALVGFCCSLVFLTLIIALFVLIRTAADQKRKEASAFVRYSFPDPTSTPPVGSLYLDKIDRATEKQYWRNMDRGAKNAHPGVAAAVMRNNGTRLCPATWSPA